MISFILTGTGNLTLLLKGKSYSVSSSHENYEKIKNGLKNLSEDNMLKLVDIPLLINKQIASVGASHLVQVSGGIVYYNGNPMDNSLTRRMLDMLSQGFDINPMVRFMENLMQNPSSRAVEELYSFLEHVGCPITPDGHFLAYKSVQNNFYSKAAGKLILLSGKVDDAGHIYNGVGETIECVRNNVDDNREHECSHGLHVGCLKYSGPGGWYNSSDNKVVIVKVNPKDAVSVPKDHNATKLRVCKYEVLGLYNEDMNKSAVYNSQAEPVQPPPKLDYYQEGYEACNNSKSLEDNPYLPTDAAFDEWDDGWYQADLELKAYISEDYSTNQDEEELYFYQTQLDKYNQSQPTKQVNYHNLRDSSGKFKKKGT